MMHKDSGSTWILTEQPRRFGLLRGCLLFLWPFAYGLTFAQEPPNSAPIGSREVTVFFRALDSKGQPVSGLTLQDIRAFDDGTETAIMDFRSDFSPAQVVLVDGGR